MVNMKRTKKIVRITGPYRKEGTKRRDGTQAQTRWQVGIIYDDGSVSTKCFADEDKCESYVNTQRVKLMKDQAEATKDIDPYPVYDESNPLGWWVKVLAVASQRLLACVNDVELRQTLRVLSGVAASVGKLQNLDEIKTELNQLKEKVNEILNGVKK